MMRACCLGLDTSCYTTSVALCGAAPGAADGLFFHQARRLLAVKAAGRGLSQSEMVFQHVGKLPELMVSLLAAHTDVRVTAVCASVRPRSRPDSYMPAFRVGEGTGRALAAALGVPFYGTSHQAGHLRAARMGTGLKADTPVIAFHLSGGTTEVLAQAGQEVRRLGGSLDLQAGQLIDRIGVAMGLSFPAGPEMERLAARGRAMSRLKTAVRDMDCHFSGAETQALAWVAQSALTREDIAAEVFSCIARTVARLALAAQEETGIADVLLGGGVSTSRALVEAVRARLLRRSRAVRVHAARPELSGDNAVGVAAIGFEMGMHKG